MRNVRMDIIIMVHHYVYDGTAACNYKPHFVGLGSLPTDCPDNYDYIGGLCYKKCPDGSSDIGLFCQKCDDNMSKDGLLCREQCDSNYTYDGSFGCNYKPTSVPAGILPTECDSNNNKTKFYCIKNPNDTDYKFVDTDLASYHLDENLAKDPDKVKSTQITNACDGLSAVTNTTTTCSGTQNINCKTTGCGCNVKEIDWDCSACNDLHDKSINALDHTCSGRTCTNITRECGLKRVTRNCTRNSCPPGSDPNGIYCYEKITTKCDSAIVTRFRVKCPSGYDFLPGDSLKTGDCYKCPSGYSQVLGDPTNKCWVNKPLLKTILSSDITEKTCSGKEKVGGLCYDSCPTGSSRIPGMPYQCQGSKGIGLYYKLDTKLPTTTAKQSVYPSCGSNKEMVCGICYPKCDADEDRVPLVPTNCMGKSHGLNYITSTQLPKTTWKGSHEADCNDNEDKTESLCYKKCENKYGECYTDVPGIPTNCMPKKGLTYQPKITGCGEGYVFDGQSNCNNSYVPKTYAKKSVPAFCPNNHDTIGGLCYKNCDPKTILDNNGNNIKLKRIEGIPFSCGAPHHNKYLPFYTVGMPFYFPKVYPKVRAVDYSSK